MMQVYRNLLKESREPKISLSTPLLIRLLEWAKEEAKDDVEIYQMAEKMIKKNRTLSTSDYEDLLK